MYSRLSRLEKKTKNAQIIQLLREHFKVCKKIQHFEEVSKNLRETIIQ